MSQLAVLVSYCNSDADRATRNMGHVLPIDVCHDLPCARINGVDTVRINKSSDIADSHHYLASRLAQRHCSFCVIHAGHQLLALVLPSRSRIRYKDVQKLFGQGLLSRQITSCVVLIQHSATKWP